MLKFMLHSSLSSLRISDRMPALLLVSPEQSANALPQCVSSHAKHLSAAPKMVSSMHGNQQCLVVHRTLSVQHCAQSEVMFICSKHDCVFESSAHALASSVRSLLFDVRVVHEQ